MDRRTFLKALGGTGATLVGAIGMRIGGFWWDQTPSAKMKLLSSHEILIVQTMAEALFPGDLGMPAGNQVGLPDFVDHYLASVSETTANLLRLLLHAIDDMAIFADMGVTRFHLRPLEDRIEILRAWDESWLGPRRGAFTSLKLIFGMGYCERPEVIQAAGLDYTCTGKS